MRNLCAFVAVALFACGVARAEDLKSGLAAGEGIGAFIVEKCAGNPGDGVESGKSLCYRCKLGGRPMVMVFARTADEHLATLVTELDKTVAANEEKKLAAFVNFLGSDNAGLKVTASGFEKKATTAHVALVVPADQPNGPADYKLAAEADVTVIIAKEGKVTANHAFAKGKLNKAAIEAIVADTAKLVN